MTDRLRARIDWFAGALGVLILGSGLFIASVMQWRLHLLAGLWLLSLPARRLIGRYRATADRSLRGLMVMAVLGFAAIGLQLARNQATQSEATLRAVASLAQPVASEPSQPIFPETDPAERTSLGSGRAFPVVINAGMRGRIVDRNGVVLAETVDGRRTYPNPALGHLIGFQSRLYGTTGLEARFDAQLSGVATLSPTAILEARLLGSPVEQVPADLTLTLDSRLQAAAQQALGERAGAVVLLDVPTGAILAMVTYPRFDPNQLVLPEPVTQADVDRVQAAWAELNARADAPLLNRATQGRYPPGSVIKTLTAAAALDSGVLADPSAPVTCPNLLPTEAGAPPVRNAVDNLFRRTGDPSDLVRVYAFSCNTAFAQVGLSLGADRFLEYARRFGLQTADTRSGPADLRDIPAEIGTIANDASFLQRPAALADTAFGQGQALVTPLDMAQMAASIANDGRLMRPYLVAEARAGERVIYQAQPEMVRQVVSPETSRRMLDMMRISVEIGYAQPIALPGVSIGAKTGTAETPRGVPHSWIVAVAPVEQPQYAIAVIVEYGGEGSRSALPVARQVLAAALGVTP
ncbi:MULTISPECIES: penicillin-binding protein 2 [Roseiflexus]|jgi:peptidoglycan glycosyltransferase|uniref:Peptidoglycan glycosyltransferase n=1 Tax=Roseiflexus castenholzii (strain DSM 13941 / HLO8) TaxID=383372 RepID=A7NGW1_ROSCS|nr:MULTISPECIES: penicillin-binding protein 2 [Roseiflexus]ABU56708.1 Peptidoglycan glycosyltransferase [Roseiflexus castenholzii DSM 13941]GIV99147.1 MAG: peptidoglycan glycosyltransferase [Roseiflexus sp.]